jgi:hypothetical protein
MMMTPPASSGAASRVGGPGGDRRRQPSFSMAPGWTPGRPMSTVSPARATRPDPALGLLAAIDLSDPGVLPSSNSQSEFPLEDRTG